MCKPPQLGHVMLIDDDQVDQMMYRRTIKRAAEVDSLISFRSAEDALAFLATGAGSEIDLIFLDINMPRMNGFEFLEAASATLGSDFSRIAVVMLTTSLDPADRARAERFEGVKAFVTKPLMRHHLNTLPYSKRLGGERDSPASTEDTASLRRPETAVPGPAARPH